ncbi:MAG: type II toxin-antitoxin system death-on-curing family toxin [Acidobacteria bacterium]|nr:type II toxin-antitoxin system death-on-curing family toxin [Acidobacteriota bacterium]MCA1619580.1 type II toxin-antitoxin system death-on-curing family toxin [Acidobacteriota bacterium]
MATEEVAYLTYQEAVLIHILLMRSLGEKRYGVFDRSLVESALARPRQSAAYGRADMHAQAASLLYGFIKNHPWVGGNKRTATALTQIFLRRNGHRIDADLDELLELVHAVEGNQWRVEDVEAWLRDHTTRA